MAPLAIPRARTAEPAGTAPALLPGVGGVFLPWLCRGHGELCLGSISYPGRRSCGGAEGAVAAGQGLGTAMVSLASGSGPAQMHGGGTQKASIESVGLFNFFIYLFFSAQIQL